MIDPITQRAQEAYVAWRRDRAERESGQRSGNLAPPPTAEMKARMKKARLALEQRGYGWLFT